MTENKNLLQDLIDIIFPIKIPSFDNSHLFGLKKNIDNLCVDNIWIANSLDDKTIYDTIIKIKEKGEFIYVKHLAKNFVNQILDLNNSDNKQVLEIYDSLIKLNSKSLLTFVPADPVRIIKRGFHLPELLIKEVINQLHLSNININSQAIFWKHKTTKRQTGLDRESRLINLKDKLKLKPHTDLSDYNKIFILDDICTTGATISECALQIKAQYPNTKVYGLAVASNV